MIPGADLVEQGLADLARDVLSAEALLVAIGNPRLRALGLPIPAREDLPAHPEHDLYDLLALRHGNDAHSRYNALIRRLVSYERAMELAQARRARLARDQRS